MREALSEIYTFLAFIYYRDTVHRPEADQEVELLYIGGKKNEELLNIANTKCVLCNFTRFLLIFSKI